MPPEGQITVTAYEGSQAGRDPMPGMCQWKKERSSNACASKGTFRLIFEIKNKLIKLLNER